MAFCWQMRLREGALCSSTCGSHCACPWLRRSGDLDGYMHPHTYVRLPDGHVLAIFQYHGGHEPKSDGGGLVEFDERGQLIRSSSARDPTAKGELIRPYSLVVVP